MEVYKVTWTKSDDDHYGLVVPRNTRTVLGEEFYATEEGANAKAEKIKEASVVTRTDLHVTVTRIPVIG